MKFCLDITAASSADLKEVLECAFGVHEDKSTLLQKFFNRNQQDESTDDYAMMFGQVCPAIICIDELDDEAET